MFYDFKSYWKGSKKIFSEKLVMIMPYKIIHSLAIEGFLSRKKYQVIFTLLQMK